jgi:hypothetical protein
VGNTTNQDLGLTSTTSGGKAQTMGATDVNLDPAKKTSAPFPNEAPNSAATTHSTSRTNVEKGPVLRQGDKVGPPSNPAHPNTGGGANAAGNPYRQEAIGQKGSPNVRVEGQPPNRITDPTTQNKANTTGQYAEAGAPAQTPGAGGTPKEACHIEKVTVECAHGRVPGDEKVLEVLGANSDQLAADDPLSKVADGTAAAASKITGTDAKRLDETIKLEAKRIDARTKGNPTCEPKTHTKWIIERTGGIRVANKKQEYPAQDKLELKGDWLNYGGDFQLKGGIKLKDGAEKGIKKDFLQGILDKKNEDRKARGQKALGMKKLGNSYKTKANQEVAYQKWNTANLNRAAQIASKAVEFGTLLEILFARKHAPTIAIKAEACSGAHNYTVRVFPPIKAEASITKDCSEMKWVKTATAALEKVLKVFQKLASMAGLPIEFGLIFAEGGGVMFEALWAEINEPNEELKLYKHMCDLGFELNFGFEKFIGIKFAIGIPVAAFVNVFVPGGGTAVVNAMNWLGVEATIGVDVDFALSPLFKIVKDPGGKADYDIDTDLLFKIFFNCKIRWKTYVEVALGVVVMGDPAFDKIDPCFPLPQMTVFVKNGEIKVGVEGYAKVDVLWWEANESINYFPESTQIRYPQFTFKPFAWASSNK